MRRAHQPHLPTELTVLLTTLGMLDGVAGRIDPEYRLVDVALLTRMARAEWRRRRADKRAAA